MSVIYKRAEFDLWAYCDFCGHQMTIDQRRDDDINVRCDHCVERIEELEKEVEELKAAQGGL